VFTNSKFKRKKESFLLYANDPSVNQEVIKQAFKEICFNNSSFSLEIYKNHKTLIPWLPPSAILKLATEKDVNLPELFEWYKNPLKKEELSDFLDESKADAYISLFPFGCIPQDRQKEMVNILEPLLKESSKKTLSNIFMNRETFHSRMQSFEQGKDLEFPKADKVSTTYEKKTEYTIKENLIEKKDSSITFEKEVIQNKAKRYLVKIEISKWGTRYFEQKGANKGWTPICDTPNKFYFPQVEAMYRAIRNFWHHLSPETKNSILRKVDPHSKYSVASSMEYTSVQDA